MQHLNNWNCVLWSDETRWEFLDNHACRKLSDMAYIYKKKNLSHVIKQCHSWKCHTRKKVSNRWPRTSSGTLNNTITWLHGSRGLRGKQCTPEIAMLIGFIWDRYKARHCQYICSTHSAPISLEQVIKTHGAPLVILSLSHSMLNKHCWVAL